MTREHAHLRPPGARAGQTRRNLILSAACGIVRERGAEALTAANVATRCGVSVRTISSLFDDPQECLTAAFEDAITLAEARAVAAYRACEDPFEGTRAGMTATLVFFDEQPEFAWLCLVHAPACPQLLLRCREITDTLARAIDHALRPVAPGDPPPWTGHAVVGGVLGAVRARLLNCPARLSTMAGSLMAMIVLPYLGPGAAQLEVMRDAAARRHDGSDA